MSNGKSMIRSDKVMYLEMFEKSKRLVNLVQKRINLIKLRQEVHKNLYNTTTEITKLELSFKKLVDKLSKQIPK